MRAEVNGNAPRHTDQKKISELGLSCINERGGGGERIKRGIPRSKTMEASDVEEETDGGQSALAKSRKEDQIRLRP